MGKRFWTIILAAVLLTGCSAKKPDPGPPVVYKITVTCRHEETVTERIYTSQPKMRQILNHLRSLGQQFTPPIDPEALSARTFHIDISFTNGSSRLYQTKADRYIRTDQAPWKQADPKQLERLNLLLLTLPPDITV